MNDSVFRLRSSLHRQNIEYATPISSLKYEVGMVYELRKLSET